MASVRALVLLALCVFLILALCVQESDSWRGGSYRSGSSYRSYRSTRVRVRQRVRNTYIGSRIRRGSGMFSSSTWKTAVLAGAIYGGARYMSSPYYRRYPNRMPPICTNNYEVAPNGRVYGHFICPRETEPANYTWCCGPSKNEFCCDEFYYGRRSSGGRRSGMSPFAIIGIILVIIAVIVVAVVCCRKKRLSKGVVVHKKTDSGAAGQMKEGYPAPEGGVQYTPAPAAAPYPAAPPTPYPSAPAGPYPPPGGSYQDAPYPPPAGPYPLAGTPYPAPGSAMPYPSGPAPGAPPPPYPGPEGAMPMPPPQGYGQPAAYPPYPQQ